MNEERRRELLSKLFQIDAALKLSEIEPLIERYGRNAVTDSLREVLQSVRKRILSGEDIELNLSKLVGMTRELLLQLYRPSLCGVINATGIIVHTGLGRAVMPAECLKSLNDIASGYCLLEMSRETGRRSHRMEHVEGLLTRLTGAEAAHVVNNDAAAVMLALRTLAPDREAICSRAEQVEIGGSFRLPDIIETSGVKLVDIGTTNRTYLSDYENAINENTGVIIKAHTSNYRISGYVTRPKLSELVELGKKNDVPFVYDIGSGAFVSLSDEPTVQDAISTGVDIVCFSGDKLLGGPQSGIIAGKDKYVSMIKKNPLARAVRVGKTTLILLEALLKIYLDPDRAAEEIPAIAMEKEPLNNVAKRARSLARKIKRGGIPWNVETIKSISELGGGSTPGKEIESMAVSLSGGPISSEELARRLRTGEPCIFPYTREEAVLFDLRTVLPGEDELLVKSLKSIAAAL